MGRTKLDGKTEDEPEFGGVAASCFEFSPANSPVWIPRAGRVSLVSQQKFRNNWAMLPLRDQIAGCRFVSEKHWLISPVLDLRHKVQRHGFRAVGGKADDYDFRGVVKDVVWENLVSSNVVCLWRKGVKLPPISVLNSEHVEYSSSGGIERISFRCSKDQVMAADRGNEAKYVEKMGQKMYDAYLVGKKITITKGIDEEWDFEVMTPHKRCGAFVTPQLLPLLDDVDFLELMKVGDWNLADFRKNVILLIRKGYAVTQGTSAGVNSVNITKKEVEVLGEGFSKIKGKVTIPTNHDVNPTYLTIDPSNFDPKQIESALDRLMVWGGIESVMLLDSFSQQNGAAPSLMHNLRVNTFGVREDIEDLLKRILNAAEFEDLSGGEGVEFKWSVKLLYSMEDLLNLTRALADGTASPQTRRGLLDLDDELESRLMREAHERRSEYTPPFEPKQGLLASLFPADFTGPSSSPLDDSGDPGRPGSPAAI